MRSSVAGALEGAISATVSPGVSALAFNAIVMRLLTNVKIYTGERYTKYDALLLDGSKIQQIGMSSDLFKRASEVIDLKGAYVYPGFVDAHAHVFGTGERVLRPRLEGARSLSDALELVRAAARKSDAPWVVLRGWDHNKWGMTEFPTKAELDALDIQKPIALTRVDGHATWCNSEALRQAGVTSSTIAPHGGEILKDSKGEPTGILLDEAMKLVESRIPSRSIAEIKDTLRAGLKEFARFGNTAVHDMGISYDMWRAYEQLYREEGDQLPRALVFMDMNQPGGRDLWKAVLNEEVKRKPHERLRLVGIKIYLDGALGSRGAELFEDYSDAPGNRGIALSEDAEVLELTGLAADRRMQIAVHAIGDKANARALDLFETSRANVRGGICRIEHAQIVRGKDLQRYYELGVWAIIQPAFFASDRHWAVQRLGEKRMLDAYRWRSFVERGIKVAASSDSPVELADTPAGIRLLVDRDGVGDFEALDESAAIELYTLAAAKLEEARDKRGTIEFPKLADLTILDRPVLDPAARTLQTFVAGNPIYDATKTSPLEALPAVNLH